MPGLASVGAAGHFFDRRGGCSAPPYDSLNVGLHVGDGEEAVAENRRRVAAALGHAGGKLAFARQVHGRAIAIVDSAGPLELEPEADILLTTAARVALAVYTADCTPLLLAGRGGVAAIHGGWRGAACHVAATGAEALAALCGESLDEMVAEIGPTIGPCCFQVGQEVADRLRDVYRDEGARAAFRPGINQTTMVDLGLLHVCSLVQAGLRRERIRRSKACTVCQAEFFSYRRDGAKRGVQASAIVRL